MGKFHAVGITYAAGKCRYGHLATLAAADLQGAAKEVIQHQSRHRVTVLRDGGTGKRYSIHECEAINGGAA